MTRFSEWLAQQEQMMPVANPQASMTTANAKTNPFSMVPAPIMTKLQSTGLQMPRILDRAYQLWNTKASNTMAQAISGAMGEFQSQQMTNKTPTTTTKPAL